jgi:hypothetical protein
MATRCTIKIDGINYAKIYKHWDGYPDGMLDWLNEFNDSFNKNRGHDPEYKFAQLLRFAQRKAKEFGLDNSRYTGWGVIPFNSTCWAEYEYILTENGVKLIEEPELKDLTLP